MSVDIRSINDHLLSDEKAREDIAQLTEDIVAFGAALTEGTNIEKKATLSFSAGEIHSGTVQADARRCYSEMVDNVLGKPFYFDDTKYKVLICYFDEDGSGVLYNTWQSTSPVMSATLASTKKKLCYEFQTKDDSAIDTADVAKTSYYIDYVLNKTAFASATVYVSGLTGNDNNDGSKDKPFKTIQRGIDSGAGNILVDTVGYAYEETLTATDRSGFRIAPLIDQYFPEYGQTPPRINISGGDEYRLVNAINFTRCDNVTLEGINAHHTSQEVAKLYHCFNFKIVDCIFHDNNNDVGNGMKDGLQIENGSGEVINCLAYNIRRDGFNIHGYGNTHFIDCVAHDCGDDAISHHDACTGTIRGGEYYNCGKGGVASPTHGAYIDVDGVYSHDNAYGLYAMTTDESLRRRIKGTVRNCVFKNNTQFDIALVSADMVGIQNIYDTKSISTTTNATFNEFN